MVKKQKSSNMKINFFLFLLSVFLLVNCGDMATEEQKKASADKEFKENINEAKEDLGGAIGNLGEAISSLKKKHNIEEKEPVSFREMKKILPDDLGGMEQTDNEGQTSGIMGFKFSTAKAVYEADKAKLEVKIVDIAGIGKLASKMADWSTLDIDKESKNGYERTTTIDGHKAYEKYDARRQKGKVAMIIDDRFIVDIEGRNVTEDQLRDAIEDINVRKLKRLVD